MLPGRSAFPRVPGEEGALNAGGQVQQVHLKEGQGQVHRMGCQRVPFMNKHSKFYSSFYLLNRPLNIGNRYTFFVWNFVTKYGKFYEYCENVTIYCGSGSEFGKVSVPVPDPNSDLDYKMYILSSFSRLYLAVFPKNCTKSFLLMLQAALFTRN
jgi:hypothetical protein